MRYLRTVKHDGKIYKLRVAQRYWGPGKNYLNVKPSQVYSAVVQLLNKKTPSRPDPSNPTP